MKKPVTLISLSLIGIFLITFFYLTLTFLIQPDLFLFCSKHTIECTKKSNGNYGPILCSKNSDCTYEKIEKDVCKTSVERYRCRSKNYCGNDGYCKVCCYEGIP